MAESFNVFFSYWVTKSLKVALIDVMLIKKFKNRGNGRLEFTP